MKVIQDVIKCRRVACWCLSMWHAGRASIVATGLALSLITPGMELIGEAGTPFGTTPSSTIHVNCPQAVMTKAPTFSSNPKGSASYPFEMQCTNLDGPGVLYLYFEGRWNPSETRQDMPNAVETLFIENYARNFISGRQQRGTGDSRIFVYWTARCTSDPWIQGGTCRRYGEYVPDDVRAAIPDIGLRPFPLTEKSISPAKKQQLVQQYLAANSSVSMQQRQQVQAMVVQPQQSQMVTQSQQAQALTVQPPTALSKPSPAISSIPRSGILSRGVESPEVETSGQEAATPGDVETSEAAKMEEGTAELTQPIAIVLDRPIHIITAKGNAAVLESGAYEVRSVMDVQLGLAKEGRATTLLHAQRSAHQESLDRPLALVIAGPSDSVHLVLLMPDGRRFDARGSASGVMPRGTPVESASPGPPVHEAIKTALATAASNAPPCRANPAATGPRWIPVPCSMPPPMGSRP